MPASIYNFSNNPELRTLLSEKMWRQMWRGHRMSRWCAPQFVRDNRPKEEVESVGPKAGTKWTGAPVEVQNAFISEGRTDYLIPIKNRLTQHEIFGDDPRRGTAEAYSYGFQSVYINRSFKAVAPPTGTNYQKVKQWARDLVGDTHSDLNDYLRDNLSSSIYLSLFTGWSRDLLNYGSGGGKKTIRSHPNFYAAGYGRVGMNPTGTDYATGGRPGTTTYEATIASALNAMSDPALQGCNVNFIKNLAFEASRQKIQKITMESGFQFYPVWIKDAAWQQFQNDPNYSGLAKSLFISELSKHPLGNGMQIYVGECAIYADNEMPAAYTAANGVLGGGGDSGVTVSVEYGPRPTAGDRAAGFSFNSATGLLDTGNIAMGALIGQSMLTVGMAEKPSFTEEIWDHENGHEVGVQWYQSIVRNETYDTLGIIINPVTGSNLTAGDFFENTSSIGFATWSPYAMSY